MSRTRNYRKEYDDYHSSDKQKKRRAQRNAARRKMKRAGLAAKGDGRDVHHADRDTGNNSRSNLKVTSKKKNRGWRKGIKG